MILAETSRIFVFVSRPAHKWKSIQLSDELNVDLAPDGTVYGIELLNANVQLRGAGGGFLVLVDEAAGRRIEVPLPEIS